MKVPEHKLVLQPVSQGAVPLGKDPMDMNHPGKQGRVSWRNIVAFLLLCKRLF